MRKDSRIFVAERDGMLGRAIIGALARQGLQNCVLDTFDLDLTQAQHVERYFAVERPTHVFLAAGKKGGIRANQRFPADLLFDNLAVATHVMRAALEYGVEKLLYVGSSCMYPRDCRQPAAESDLLTGPLEPTSEAYATGKLAALKLCQAIHRQYRRRFIAAIPTNIYGPYDSFDPENAHVVGALIRKLAAAKREKAPDVCLWGTGNPRREFLFADDFGSACVFLMENYENEGPINMASGEELSVRDLAEQIAGILGYEGTLRFDPAQPDGALQKSLDGSHLTVLGWGPEVSLTSGLRQTCQWYLDHCGPKTRSRKEKCRV